jgi:hypothetical protein
MRKILKLRIRNKKSIIYLRQKITIHEIKNKTWLEVRFVRFIDTLF